MCYDEMTSLNLNKWNSEIQNLEANQHSHWDKSVYNSAPQTGIEKLWGEKMIEKLSLYFLYNISLPCYKFELMCTVYVKLFATFRCMWSLRGECPTLETVRPSQLDIWL